MQQSFFVILLTYYEIDKIARYITIQAKYIVIQQIVFNFQIINKEAFLC